MKTPEEIKKLIAKRNGFDDWNDLTREWTHRAEMTNVVHEKYVDDAIEFAFQELQRLSKENDDLRKQLHDHNGMCQKKLGGQAESFLSDVKRLSKEKEELEKTLGIIRERNFARMLEKVTNGIIHRADTYNTPDQFEDNGTYEEYARYTGPAQGKLIDAFIEQALNPKE